jgi:S-adenosylmethionine decarboxylase
MAKTRKNKTKTNAWGYHLIVNAGLCESAALRSKAVLTTFAKQLVKDINMKAYGPPHVYRFGEGTLLGLSMFQLIETSNITVHCDETSDDVYLDIFSCKWFDKAAALKLIRSTFIPTHLDYTFTPRQARHR